FDTIERERAASKQLDRLRGDLERPTLQAVAASARPVVSRLADYLESAAGPGNPGDGRQLDPARLAAWSAYLKKAAADPKDLFHAFALAAQGGNLSALAATERARLSAAEKALEKADVLF